MKPKRTILCVDDDERSLSIRKVLLQTRGYRVLTCSDPEAAIDILKLGGVDLVLTDLMMPKINGAKLIDQMKAISPETPALLFSGSVNCCSRRTSGRCLAAERRVRSDGTAGTYSRAADSQARPEAASDGSATIGVLIS